MCYKHMQFHFLAHHYFVTVQAKKVPKKDFRGIRICYSYSTASTDTKISFLYQVEAFLPSTTLD